MPTLVRVRGKHGNKKRVTSSQTDKSQATSMMQHTNNRPLSNLEKLPTELIQAILLESWNLNLSSTSPTLASKLNNNSLRRKIVSLACFEYSVWFKGSSGDKDLLEEVSGNTSFTGEAYQPRLRLFNDIIDQAWFSAEIFFSSYSEYIHKIVPPRLICLIGSDFKTALGTQTRKRDVFQQIKPKYIPQWFIDFTRIENPDEQCPSTTTQQDPAYLYLKMVTYGAGRFTVTCESPLKSDINRANKFSWTIRETDGRACFLSASVDGFDCEEELNPRLFNPKSWTTGHLTMLRWLVGTYNATYPKSEVLTAISAGLTTAISQKFVPAVFTQCQTWIREKNNDRMNWKDADALLTQIRNYAQQQADHGDVSASTEWLIAKRNEGTCMWGHLARKSSHFEEPISHSHLRQAMNVLCEPDFDIASYYIFCWISINWVIMMFNYEEAYPEGTLKQIHSLALATGTEHALKGYNFFNEVVNVAWAYEGHLHKDAEE